MESWNVMINIFQARFCYKNKWQDYFTELYTTMAILGAMISSLSSGFLMKYGKQRLLIITNLVLIFGNSIT